MKNIKKIFALCVVLAVFPIYVHADYSSIDKELSENVKKYHLPGMAVIEVDDNGILFQKTYGNVQNVDQVFLIGSLSKSFTAAAVMQLVEKGNVDLDAPVSEYIDCEKWFAHGSDYKRITVKNLLNQTSGIKTYAKMGSLKSTGDYGKYVYANSNYGLLGLIIESVSGLSYEDYIKENIFNPLGMTHSYASLNDGAKKELVPGYKNYFGFWVPSPPDYPDKIKSGQWTNVPGGYIVSSAGDMGKYLAMYLKNGENVLTKDSVRKMFFDNVPEDDEDSYYGMGWECIKNEYGVWIMRHTGLVENYCAFMYVNPAQNKAGAVLVNMNDYLVDNMFLENIIAPLFDQKAEDKSKMFFILHSIIDLVFLALIFFALYPVITLKKWKNKKKNIFIDILRHLVFPLILLIPVQIIAPLFVIRMFAKDVWLVLVISSILLFAIGIYKIIYAVSCKKKSKSANQENCR